MTDFTTSAREALVAARLDRGRGDRKKDAVYHHILEQMMCRRYRFGDKIPIGEVAEATGASRQPIMAAIADLRTAGFVLVTAQVGCEVVTPTAGEVEDFYLMFGRMEGLIAELAARRQRPGEARALQKINRSFAALNRNGRDASGAYLELNRCFHRGVHELTRSPALHRQQSLNWAFSDFLIAQTYEVPPRLDLYVGEHDAIVTAILANDPAAACAAAEIHINSVSILVRSAMS